MDGLPKYEDFKEDKSLNELAHPRRIVLHDPRQVYLSHFNELYRSYQRLENYMHDSDQPQEEIDKVKAKAANLFGHLRTLHKND